MRINNGRNGESDTVLMVFLSVLVCVGIIVMVQSDKEENAKREKQIQDIWDAAAKEPVMTLGALKHYDGCEIRGHHDSDSAILVDEHKGWSRTNLVGIHLAPEMYASAKKQSTLDWNELNTEFGEKAEQKK